MLEELVSDAGLEPESSLPFKGNIDLDQLREYITKQQEYSVR
ncbi:MAG: hypothetical protein R2912_04585 [Eubacteriales bacterium]